MPAGEGRRIRQLRLKFQMRYWWYRKVAKQMRYHTVKFSARNYRVGLMGVFCPRRMNTSELASSLGCADVKIIRLIWEVGASNDGI